MILILSHNYYPEPTGIPFYNTDMARYWVGRGVPVTVCTGMPHYPWWRVPAEYAARDYRRGGGDEVDQGVRVLRVRHFVPNPPVGGLGRMRLDLSYLLAWFRRGLTLRQRPRLIIAVAPPFMIGFLALVLRLRFRRGVPIIYHVQDLQVDAALDLEMLPGALRAPLLFLERLQLRLVDQVTTVSRSMQRRLQAKGPTRRPVRLWPNWADTAHLQPNDTSTNHYRQAWDLPSDAVVVMYSGNLGKKQGLDDLLAAAVALRHEQRLHWVIAGQGAERARLEQQGNELRLPRLRWLDLQPLAQLGAFLSAGDLHVLPQKSAAADLVMPSKLLNIFAVGRPVIACAEPETELHTLITAARAGWTCAPENPAALAEKIQQATIDTSTRRRAGGAARRWVSTHLERTRVLDRVLRLGNVLRRR